MKKLSQDDLLNTIHEILKFSNETRKRKFVETVELQVGLHQYDFARSKKFGGSIVLPYKVQAKKSFIIMGEGKHIAEANNLQISHIDSDGLRKFNKDRKTMKKFFKGYDVLVSESLARQIPRLLGPSRGSSMSRPKFQFPRRVSHDVALADTVDELQRTIKFQLKKVSCLSSPVGTVDLTPDQLLENVNISIYFLISLLKEGWRNVKSLHLKSSMGSTHQIYSR